MAIGSNLAERLQEYLTSDLPALRCVAPLLSKVNEPEWPPEATLGIKASCVAVKVGDISAVLTASHALREKHSGVETLFAEDNVVVLYSVQGVRRDLHVRKIVRSAGDPDPDIAAVFLEAGSTFDNETIVPFDNKSTPGMLEPHAEPGDVFLILGYPNDLATIEYSAEGSGLPHNVVYQAQRLAGQYVGSSSVGEGMHEVKFVDPTMVVRPQGMSGGGVFRVLIDADESASEPFSIAFVGIATHGSSERMHFVELRKVFSHLLHLLDKL
jgi:hypothetical protein